MPKRDQDFFWEGVDRGKLLAQRCDDCGTLRHPPAPMCAQCQSLKWSQQELSGEGTVFSWLISKHPNDESIPSRTVLLVQLKEGLRLVSNLVEAETTEIGAPVELAIGDMLGLKLPLFRNARGGYKK